MMMERQSERDIRWPLEQVRYGDEATAFEQAARHCSTNLSVRVRHVTFTYAVEQGIIVNFERLSEEYVK